MVDEQKTHIPSIGGLRRSTNKVRIENNPIKSGQTLNPDRRVTNSVMILHQTILIKLVYGFDQLMLSIMI